MRRRWEGRVGTLGGLKLELRLALGSAVGALAFLVLTLSAVLALAVGAAKTGQQRFEIERAGQAHDLRFAEKLESRAEPEDAGTVAYEDFHIVADPPSPWAFVALGARDGATPLQRVRMLGLEAQIHDGELVHPDLSAAGVFDFAFVVIFLLPLTLVAILHDLRSAESESGRLDLLSSLVVVPRRFWLTRVAVRLCLALAAVLGPLLVFVLVLGAPLSVLPTVVSAVAAYGVAWALLASAVALRAGATTTGSAISLLSLWCLSVLVLPGIVGALASQAHPSGLGAEIVLAQRQKVNDAWDLPKEATFEPFFEHYPEWKDTPPVTEGFHWKWYYAFHEVGDLSVAKQVSDYQGALRAQERAVARWSVTVPAVALQRILTALAETDAVRQWSHGEAIRRFHARLRAYFYPFIFDELPITKADIRETPVFESAPSSVRQEPFAALGLSVFLALSVLLVAATSRNWGRSPSTGSAK